MKIYLSFLVHVNVIAAAGICFCKVNNKSYFFTCKNSIVTFTNFPRCYGLNKN